MSSFYGMQEIVCEKLSYKQTLTGHSVRKLLKEFGMHVSSFRVEEHDGGIGERECSCMGEHGFK